VGAVAENVERESLEDIDCQEYALFFLARLVSDRNVLLMVFAQAEQDTAHAHGLLSEPYFHRGGR
jgi:hypothetical protein